MVVVPPTIQFLQAKHYRPGPRHVSWVVIHSAEIGESLEGAEALMRVCANNPRVASWHYAVDADSITQSVREDDIAFHAPGANQFGIGIELTGRARQTAAEWLDDFSTRTLELTAWLVADICLRRGLPVRFVGAQDLLRGQPGITTHHEVSQAWRKSDHWDPGPNFPMQYLLSRVQAYADKSPTDPAPPMETTLPDLRLGDSGESVRELQRQLNAAQLQPAITLVVDGRFGLKTSAAVRRFQRARDLPDHGIVDEHTWEELFK
jgi:N-acetyl-anhydromuramyl-L-alanine amidase AmpD